MATVSPVVHALPPPVSRLRWDLLAALAAVCIAGLWAGRVSYFENHHEDLWIYSSGGWFGFQGVSPYSTERMHARVAERWAGDPNLDGNNGFFLAPQAMLIFGGFAFLPWTLAKLLWSGVMIGLTILAARHLTCFAASAPQPWHVAGLICALLLNPLSMFVLIVGQTTLLFVALVALGEWCEQRGSRRWACVLWALAFFKPHIALPLLPLAWALGGWRRAVELGFWVLALNALAGLITLGDPLILRDYMAYLPHAHKSVEFNRVTVNIQISSWNRWLIANGGPTIELGMATTLAGYGVWLMLLLVRCRLAAGNASRSWMLAAAAAGACVCCQLLPYELVLLGLTLPYLLDLSRGTGRLDRPCLVVFLILLAWAMLPGGEGGLSEVLAQRLGGRLDNFAANCGWPLHTEDALMSHRSFACLLLAGLVWLRGPRFTLPQDSASQTLAEQSCSLCPA